MEIFPQKILIILIVYEKNVNITNPMRNCQYFKPGEFIFLKE